MSEQKVRYDIASVREGTNRLRSKKMQSSLEVDKTVRSSPAKPYPCSCSKLFPRWTSRFNIIVDDDGAVMTVAKRCDLLKVIDANLY